MILKLSVRWLVGLMMVGFAMDLYGQQTAGFGMGRVGQGQSSGGGSGFGSEGSAGMGMGGPGGMGMGMGAPIGLPPMKIELNGEEIEATELYPMTYRHGSYVLGEYVPTVGGAGFGGMAGGEMGMGGEGGYGSSMGSGAGMSGYGASDGAGAGMGGMGSGLGAGITSIFYLYCKATSKQWQRPEVELVFAERTITKEKGGGPQWKYYRFRDQLKDMLPSKEIDMVEKLATQKVWRDSIFRSLGQLKSLDGVPTALEPQLRQLLGEQYETQLLRQSLEADAIEVRLQSLRQEIERRRVAKDRVIDVQAGRLLLDAQGLLNDQ